MQLSWRGQWWGSHILPLAPEKQKDHWQDLLWLVLLGGNSTCLGDHAHAEGKSWKGRKREGMLQRDLAAGTHGQEWKMERKSPVFSFVPAVTWITHVSIQHPALPTTRSSRVWKSAGREGSRASVKSNEDLWRWSYSSTSLQEVCLPLQVHITHKHTQAHSPLLTAEAPTESTFPRFYFYICKKQVCFCFQFLTIIVKCPQESSSVFPAEWIFDVQHCTQMFLPFQNNKRTSKWMSQGKNQKSLFPIPQFSGPDQRMEAALWHPLTT